MERLRRSDRLHTKCQFEAVFRGGTRVNTPYLSLVVKKTRLDYSRIGVSVSRKAGNAVKRNRLKRWVREVFRRNRAAFPACADTVVLITRPVTARFDEFQRAMLQGAARAR